MFSQNLSREFLRFTMSKQAFWTKSKAYRSISKVSFLTAVDIPVYSESFIPNRFLRNMSIMYLSEEDAIATTIPCYFKSMINSAVSNNSSMDPSILTDLDKIVASTIALYISLKDKIPKRVESPLKLFSTNDIQRVIEGVVGEVVKPGKQALDLIIPLVWIQECHRIFVVRKRDGGGIILKK